MTSPHHAARRAQLADRPIPDTLGGRVRQLREEQGLSQAQLAELAGVAGNTISRCETGVTSPSREVLSRLARALSTSVADLDPDIT